MPGLEGALAPVRVAVEATDEPEQTGSSRRARVEGLTLSLHSHWPERSFSKYSTGSEPIESCERE